MANVGDIFGTAPTTSISDITGKRRYNLPKREQTNREICERLNLAPRIFDRYLHDIYALDNQLLINPSIQATLTQTSIFIYRLTKQRQDVLTGLANNPDIDPNARVNAHHLVGEISRAIHKLSYEAPSYLARKVNLESRMFGIEQRGLNLIVKNESVNQLPSNRESNNDNVVFG